MKTKATARVTVVLVVDLGASWGADCSVGQVFAQAADDARGRVTRLIGTGNGVSIADVKVSDVWLSENAG